MLYNYVRMLSILLGREILNRYTKFQVNKLKTDVAY